jgi:hypothetical protein
MPIPVSFTVTRNALSWISAYPSLVVGLLKVGAMKIRTGARRIATIALVVLALLLLIVPPSSARGRRHGGRHRQHHHHVPRGGVIITIYGRHGAATNPEALTRLESLLTAVTNAAVK